MKDQYRYLYHFLDEQSLCEFDRQALLEALEQLASGYVSDCEDILIHRQAANDDQYVLQFDFIEEGDV